MDARPQHVCGAIENACPGRCSFCAALAVRADKRSRTMLRIISGEEIQLDILRQKGILDLTRRPLDISRGQNARAFKVYEEEQKKVGLCCPPT